MKVLWKDPSIMNLVDIQGRLGQRIPHLNRGNYNNYESNKNT